jgi:hypothetical protein
MRLNRAEKDLVQKLIEDPNGSWVVDIMGFIDYQKGGEKDDSSLHGMEEHYDEYRQDGVDFVKLGVALDKIADDLKTQMAQAYANSLNSGGWRTVFQKVNQAKRFSWGSSITPRMASRVASAYLEKQGFNKYNAPELVGQLMSVLEKNGLEDTVAELKQKGFTRLINNAWQNRER